MPRAPRSILLRVDIRPAGRRCSCKRNPSHTIVKGALRFVLKEPGPAAPERTYCADCGLEMVTAAIERLRILERNLDMGTRQ